MAAFAHLDIGALCPSVLFVLNFVLTLLGYILFDVLDGGALRQESGRKRKN